MERKLIIRLPCLAAAGQQIDLVEHLKVRIRRKANVTMMVGGHHRQRT
jgi:hypothetical protein